MKISKLSALLFGLPLLAPAETHRYIVQLTTEPAMVFAKQHFGAHKQALTRPEVEVHRTRVLAEQNAVVPQIEALGGKLISRTVNVLNSLTVEIPEEKLQKLAAIPGIKVYQRPQKYQLHMDAAVHVHNFPAAVYDYNSTFHTAASGANITISILDTGIDNSLSVFNDLSGSNSSRIDSNLDFTSDSGFAHLWDSSGHGTTVASIAAGGPFFSGPTVFAGAAPGASIEALKVVGSNGTWDSSVVLSALEYHGGDVINLSLGSFPPVHGTDNAVSQALNNRAEYSVVVSSAGNNGNGLDPAFPIFASDANGRAPITLPGLVAPEGSGRVIQVGASSNSRALSPSLTIGDQKFQVLPLSKASLQFSQTVPIVDAGQACKPLATNGTSPLIGAIAVLSTAGWDTVTGDCDPWTMVRNVQAAGAIGFILCDAVWEDLPGFFNYLVIYNDGNDFYYDSTLPIPGAAVTLQDGTAIRQLVSQNSGGTATLNLSSLQSVSLNSDRIPFFSSRGPNSDFEIKPDLVAVGENIMAAASVGDPENGCTVYSCFRNNNGFVTPVTGTSASSAIVSGAAAVLMASRSNLSTDDYRSLLINNTTPIHNAFGGPARVMEAGSGNLNVGAALSAPVTITPPSLSFGIGDGTSTVTKTFTIKNISGTPQTGNIGVSPNVSGYSPQLSQTSYDLSPNATVDITVTIPANSAGLGEHDGFITVGGSGTHLAYWYGIPGAPALLTDMGTPLSFGYESNVSHGILFRLTDASGIVLNSYASQVQVTYSGVDVTCSGGTPVPGLGSVNRVYDYESFSPGTIAVDLTQDTTTLGCNVFHVQAGPVGVDYLFY